LSFPIVRRERHEHVDAPHPLALLRARRERPSYCRAAEKCDELAPFHCPMPPVLPNEKNSIPRHGRRLLRRGISIQRNIADGSN
jgi:hypothetical protein